MKKIMLVMALGVLLSVRVFAESYGVDYPAYVPVSGGAWAEVDTSQGLACVSLSSNYQFDTFGFSGSGYNICNLTVSTVSGTIYFQSPTSYYGRPTSLQCRFARMGTMEVYAPYQSSYGGTSYSWEALDISTVHNTNIAFTDSQGDRQNNAYIYSTTDKLLIVSIVLCAGLLLYHLFRRGWKA